MKRFIACLALALLPLAAQAQNYSDIWWNPAESGWGLTIADHQSNLFAVWYTYRQDGKPTWYVIPGGTLTNGRTHFQGDVYATTGPAFSTSPFDSSRVVARKAGTATIDFAASGTATFAFNIDGISQSKQIQRQPFGSAAPVWGTDVTDIWYDPAESGWGLTLAQHGDNVFGVWFTYDTDGQPLWAVMPGVTFNGSSAFAGSLYTTTGPHFAVTPFDPSRVIATQQGSASVVLSQGGANAQCAGTQAATLQTSLRGASRQMPICHEPFGDAPPTPSNIPRAPGLLEGPALFTAPPNPVNVSSAVDESRAGTAVIGTAGGSVSTTDGKGNRYTLTVPAGALIDDTAISITPITTLTGVTYASGVVAGVKLEPDGLVLQDNATLTIVPAIAFPLAQQTGFAAAGNGQDLHMASPGPDFAQVQLSVGHFSLWGWFLMSTEERNNAMRIKLAAENAARLENWIAMHLFGKRTSQLTGATDGNEPPPSIDQVTAWVDAYRSLVINPLIQSAATSCVDAGKALDAVNFLHTVLRQIGLDNQAEFADQLNQVRRAFAVVARNAACYFKETATFTDNDSDATTIVTARWHVSEQNGKVYTYKPTDGSLLLDYRGGKPCKLFATKLGLDKGDGFLIVDWNARTYVGAALHDTPVRIDCGPGATADSIYPVFYLGLLEQAKGSLQPNGSIKKATMSAPDVLLTLEYQFDLCGASDAIYCGNNIQAP